MTGTVVPPASFGTVTEDFSAITALNNASTVYIEYTLAGASSTAGSNFLDNIQFNATTMAAAGAVPEPSTYACMIGAFGMLTLVYYRRRHV